jgi:hypothetical protein
VGYSPASGSFFPVGTTTVTATATDAVGHTASCTFTVTVVDAQNPTESFFNLKVTSRSNETVEIRMFDMLGKIVQQQRSAPVQTYRFGDNVVSGMYIIEVRQAGQIATTKVMKQ